MRPLNKLIIITVSLMLPGANQGWAADADGAATLLVQVEGLKSDEGDLRLVLFSSKTDFLKKSLRAEILKINDRHATWTVDDLPYGNYAVLVHHDLNANGKMERHWYGKPKEPTGTSNDPPARMGPPLWKKANFELNSQTQTVIITVN